MIPCIIILQSVKTFWMISITNNLHQLIDILCSHWHFHNVIYIQVDKVWYLQPFYASLVIQFLIINLWFFYFKENSRVRTETPNGRIDFGKLTWDKSPKLCDLVMNSHWLTSLKLKTLHTSRIKPTCYILDLDRGWAPPPPLLEWTLFSNVLCRELVTAQSTLDLGRYSHRQFEDNDKWRSPAYNIPLP